MAFTFDVTGGFTPQTINLAASATSAASTTTNVLPVSLYSIPAFSMLAVVDSQARGLLMVDIRSAAVAANYN
jgi:hypothetical protein